MTPRDVLEKRLADPSASWAVGSYGAVAEFHWDAGEPGERLSPLGLATARGSVRIGRWEDALPLAWEGPRSDGNPWTQGAALCLPAEAARMGGRRALARLEDREDGALFDIGVGAPHVDACVIADAALAKALDASVGRSVWEEGSPALGLIKEAGPPRLFRSRLAEVRVNQRIGSRARRIPNPEGPHTHVLRDLLGRGLAFSPEIPVPAGTLPCLYLYPAHPVRDELGRARPFDAAAHAEFQALLAAWGPPDYLAAKRALADHAEGRGPRPARIDPRAAAALLAQREAEGLDSGRARELARDWGVPSRGADAA